MSGHKKIGLIPAVIFAAALSVVAVVVRGMSAVPVTEKLTPSMVAVDTSSLAPKLAEAEMQAVWRLFDRDTETSYMPSQTARVTVNLPDARTISRLRVYGASSYQLNVYDENGKPVPSLSGIDLTTLGSSWNSITPSETFSASSLLLEFIPQGNITAGIREIELWGPENTAGQESMAQVSLDNIVTPRQALDILDASPSHILEFSAAPSEISVAEGATPSVSLGIVQNPVLFKRAYLLYDGYNLVRSVSIQRRINAQSWAGGFVIPQPDGASASWSSYIEEINPAWLVQGENKIEFRTSGGSASIRGLKVVVETDSGWNSVSSVSVPQAYDGDTTTSYKLAAASSNPTLDITFERTVQPEVLKLHLSGAMRLTGGLQYQNGTTWQDVKAGWQIDFSTMQSGWNEIAVPAAVSTRGLRLVFNTSGLRMKRGVQLGLVNEIRVCAGPVGSPSNDPRIVISYPRDGEYFGRTAYIQGFAMPASDGVGNVAQISIEGKSSSSNDGSFSLSLSKDDTRFASQADNDPWDPAVTSTYGGNTGASLTLSLSKNSGNVTPIEPKSENRGNAPFADNREKYTERVPAGQAKKIQYKGVMLDIPEGAVDKDTDITIIPLTEPDLGRYNPGMINVTYPAAGYRFLPHGMKFKKAIKISFGYSKTLFASGQTENDVNMYYYDESLLQWMQLTRVNVDPGTSQVTSSSDHFTDIINSTLVVPEHPQALSFNPNSIKDIKAADPSANIDLIEPPKANNMGTANLSYPLKVPKGRGAYTPDLRVTYSSSNVNGWMGLGWDIPISKIQVDTRWGVPRYDSDYETESYLLDGAALDSHTSRPFAVNIARSTGDKTFTKRVEGDFHRIIRKNTTPSTYYWEVTDKNGVKYIYGQSSQARLADYQNGNIFQWNLEKVIDTNGNVTDFSYNIDSGNNGEPYRQIYLSSIAYTSHQSKTGTKDKDASYYVVFNRSSSRPDVIIDGKPGFQVRTGSRLESVDVKYKDTIIRKYEFTYLSDTEAKASHFGKSIISRIAEKGLGGEHEFYHHDFKYREMEQGAGGYVGFKPDLKQWPNISGGQGLTEQQDKMKSVAISVGIAPSSNSIVFGLSASYGQGTTTTDAMFMDIDGDGLPDRIHKGGSVELNKMNSTRDGGTFRPSTFSGLGDLGFSRQDNFTVGAQVSYWYAAANFAYSYNFVNGEKMMADIDGDGFVDQVSVGSGMAVLKNTGSSFNSVAWNGYSTDNVNFNNGAASDKLKGDFFLADPVRKWIAPFKGTVHVKGTVTKTGTGGKDEAVDKTDPNSPQASVLAFIYKNSDQTALWSTALKADGSLADASSSASHDLTVDVVPGDRLYFRVNSVDDIDGDTVSWQPEVTYGTVCPSSADPNVCTDPTGNQYLLKDQLGGSLLSFQSGSDLRLTGYPHNVWGAGAKGTVRVKGTIVKKKTTDDVQFEIRKNETAPGVGGTVLWSGSATADQEGEFSHNFTVDVTHTDSSADKLTFNIKSDTTVDPDQVAWHPEVVYETYCITSPSSSTDQPEDLCGPLACNPDSNSVMMCTVGVNGLPAEAAVEEKTIHFYGQVNYPFYYLTPTNLSRFWVAPYDGKVRIRGTATRTINPTEYTSGTVATAVAMIRGVNQLFWKQTMPKTQITSDTIFPIPGSDTGLYKMDSYSHDVEVPVNKGDQLFFDFQVEGYQNDPAGFDWQPYITYSEYCTTDPTTSQKACYPITETGIMTATRTEKYTANYDDNQDGVTDRTVSEETSCPTGSGPESGLCSYCITTTEVVTDPTTSQPTTQTQQSCQTITCTNDTIEGVKDCMPKSFIYEGRQADVRYFDPGYYYEDAPSELKTGINPEAFAGGYRYWLYGDWNGNLTWDESKIKRSTADDDPSGDEKNYDPNKEKDRSTYAFVYMTPQWQGADDYTKPVWHSRGKTGFIGAEAESPSRVGANVGGIIAGTTVNTLQQTNSDNTAYGVSLGLGLSYSRGNSVTSLDFMDMNGDGFPDQVSSGGVMFNNGVNGFYTRPYMIPIGEVRNIYNDNQSTMLTFTLPQNQTRPKGATVKLMTPGASLGNANGTSDTKSDLMDINGDGLPDRVMPGGMVQLNLGYRFGNPMAWTGAGGNVRLNKNNTDSMQASFAGIGGGMSDTEAETVTDLRDVNGDGIPDLVTKNEGDPNFYVQLNYGDRFGPLETWGGPSFGGLGSDSPLNYTETESYNITAGIVIMIPIPGIPVVWIDITPTFAISGGTGGSEVEFMDMNGDGLADHVMKNDGSGTVLVKLNNADQVNILEEVRRPLGGKFTIAYERRGNTVDWPHSQLVMTKVVLTDGMGRTYTTKCDYGDGYYSRDEREFYGFDKVVETQAPDTSIQRSTTQTFNNKDYYLRNLLQASVTSDINGHVWAKKADTYDSVILADDSEFPQLKQTDTYFYDGTSSESGYRKRTYETFAYDSYGNVKNYYDAGEPDTKADDISASISYTQYTGPYIVGKPLTILITNASGKELRKRDATYDSETGNMQRLTMYNTGVANSVWTMSYDPYGYGNLYTITDPVNYVLTYDYDYSDTATYVIQITDNFPAPAGPYYSKAEYNPYYGQLAWSRDESGNYDLRLYDEFGRLQYVYGPYDTTNSEPPSGVGTATIAFAFTNPSIAADGETLNFPAHAVTYNKAVSRVGNQGKTLDTVTYLDGMKRVIQTKKEADANGAYGMIITGPVVFDELGRIVKQGQPVFEAGYVVDYTSLSTLRNPTIFYYDMLDRTIRLETPDSHAPDGYAATTTTYGFGQLNNAGPVYALTTVIDPEGNLVNGSNRRGTKTSFRDVDGRIVAVVEYNNGIPITTTYEYDPLGQITQVTDDEKNITTVDYDELGHRTAITNPDTGKTVYNYDANGNLIGKSQANNNNITYNYTFNRLMGIDYPNNLKTAPITYEYGFMNEGYNRGGRIKKVTDESGQEVRYYGKLGEVVKEEKTVEAHTPAVQKKTFTTEYVFDSFGRMTQMTYPDGETLYYSYDNGGLLKAAWGEKSGNRYNYITSLIYDEFGQRIAIAYGNGVTTNYTYDPTTRRMTALKTTILNGRVVQNLSYHYDLVGNVLNLENGILTPTNTALPAGPVAQNFRYDDLYQLTHGDGAYNFGPGKQNTYTNDFLYDSIGNMTKKTQVHTIIQPSMTQILPKETNYVLSYVYGSSHPHAVTDAGDKLYSYDASGNMLGWSSKTNGTRRIITWNEENRVKQIEDNGKTTYFLYDDAGDRVVKRGQHGETIYVNRFYSIRNGELGTKHVFAGETRVLSKLVKTPPTNTANTSGSATTTISTTTPGINGLDNGRGKKLGIIKRLPDGYQTSVNQPAEKDFFYYHTDHLGNNNMISDVSGEIYQHLEYFPYGETWIEEGGSYGGNTPGYKFTGKELDPETGLYYYGARYYDPVLSKWISADPILAMYVQGIHMGGVFNAKNLALYIYGYNNPINFMDPDGTRGEFPVTIVGKINDWGIRSNAIERSISTVPPLGWFKSISLGKNCILLHNAIIQDVLYKNQKVKVGDRIIGPHSTHEALQKANKASALTTFAVVDEKGNPAKGNATAYALKKSVGDWVKKDYEGEGVKVYGLSVDDGLHSLTLTYGKNKEGQLEFNLYDQGPATHWYSGNLTFKTPQELDKALNKYLRAGTTRGHRIGETPSGYEYKADVSIYQIYSDKEK